MNNSPIHGSIRIICPRCGTSFVPVRGKLPIHTIHVNAMKRDGLYQTKRAKVCE